ncbi:ubiquitin carboxyl-terminal hydrolase MINDY-1 [Rosa sericea]
MASSEEEPPQQSQEPPQQSQQQPQSVKDCLHKTKLIQFLGRTAPVVLQNDNGPCPLLAICNVLSLRNNLNLSADTTEVSQEKLLSLVAERLIDSNSNIDNKDAGYVENQQQNIADAIDLLPRLATGIDVNIKFRRISDFEFTPECAIFDLLDIPLYHGWIVDPQDHDTANAIGSKSYNTLTGELVALETQNMESESKGKNIPQEDCVDFVAATTATLGVPSPSLSKTRSFDESPHSASDEPKVRKGDREEEAELLMALQMSEAELPTAVGDPFAASIDAPLLVSSDESTHLEKVMPVGSVDKSEKHDAECSNSHQSELSVPDNIAPRNESSDLISFETAPGQTACSSRLETTEVNNNGQPTSVKSEDLPKDLVTKSTGNESDQIKGAVSFSPERNNESIDENHTDVSKGGEKFEDQVKLATNADGIVEINKQIGSNMTQVPCLSASNVGSDSSSGRMLEIDESETLTSSGEGSEPIYEGEERILDSGTTVSEQREPVYEGEAVLAKQADKGMLDARSKDEITPQEGELIRNFLKNNASQLTFSGLFCLQEGLKERELCVFFRNNHFSTMFKINGELYLLATDQGYLNQHDLVWEKLNEVNGDTLFMTGNFKEFKVESQSNENWDENNAVTSTADYLASIDSAASAGFDLNSDLQLAIALQQQEFEQQPQQQQQRQNVQQPSISGNSRMVTGPQGPRHNVRTSTTSSSPRPEKPKEKCIIM